MIDAVSITPEIGSQVGDRFVIKAWQDEAVAYDLLSGDTHLLEPLALAIVDRLAEGACSQGEMLGHLSAEFGTRAEDNMAELLDNALAQLQRIGVIATP